MAEKIPSTLATYRKLSGMPMGSWLFTRVVCLRAPYFSSISPRILGLEPGRCEVWMAKRRRVQNHIGTVHAIACCNLCELAAGLASDVSVPTDMRWIPRGMQVEYLKKADTDLRAVCTMPTDQWQPGSSVSASVDVLTESGECAVRAAISMYISARKPA